MNAAVWTFPKLPGVKSPGPRRKRVNGSVAQWAGVILPVNFVISLPRTPSRVIWFGHVRFMPVGLNAPW